MADRRVVVELWAGPVPRHEQHLRELPTVVGAEPRVVHIGTWAFTDETVKIGSHPDRDVVIEDRWVSRTALVIAYDGNAHRAVLTNGNGIQYRRWGQAAQPLRGVARASDPGPVDRPPVTLDHREHAFIMFGGEHRETVYMVLVQVGGRPGRSAKAARSDVTPTPPHWAIQSAPSSGHIDKFRQMYWEFLVWPPLLYPRPWSRRKFRIDPGHAHSAVIRLATTLGYQPPEELTAVQHGLPEWLAERGLLTFEEHCHWRGPDGLAVPYLTPEEKAARDIDAP